MGLSRIAAVLVLSLGVAAAQPKPAPPTTQQKAEIEKLAKQAIAKSQKGDHEGAIKDYLDAYAIHPSTGVNGTTVLLSNVGHEYKKLSKPYEALKYFCMYLEKEPTGTAASYVLAEASGIWKELGNKEGEVCVKKAEPPPDPPPNVTGTENIQKPPPPPPPPPGGNGMKFAGLGIAGAGVIALGAGFFFGMKAQEKSDLIDGGPPLDNDGNQLDWGRHDEFGWDGIAQIEADGKKYEKYQIGLTVAGGVMVIGGTALYFLGRSKGKEAPAVSASATKDSAGLVFSGRW